MAEAFSDLPCWRCDTRCLLLCIPIFSSPMHFVRFFFIIIIILLLLLYPLDWAKEYWAAPQPRQLEDCLPLWMSRLDAMTAYTFAARLASAHGNGLFPDDYQAIYIREPRCSLLNTLLWFSAPTCLLRSQAIDTDEAMNRGTSMILLEHEQPTKMAVKAFEVKSR